MDAAEVISSEDGVTLARAMRKGHTLYLVTCARVPGFQAFHSLEQAIQCFGLELLLCRRRQAVGMNGEGV